MLAALVFSLVVSLVVARMGSEGAASGILSVAFQTVVCPARFQGKPTGVVVRFLGNISLRLIVKRVEEESSRRTTSSKKRCLQARSRYEAIPHKLNPYVAAAPCHANLRSVT